MRYIEIGDSSNPVTSIFRSVDQFRMIRPKLQNNQQAQTHLQLKQLGSGLFYGRTDIIFLFLQRKKDKSAMSWVAEFDRSPMYARRARWLGKHQVGLIGELG